MARYNLLSLNVADMSRWCMKNDFTVRRLTWCQNTTLSYTPRCLPLTPCCTARPSSAVMDTSLLCRRDMVLSCRFCRFPVINGTTCSGLSRLGDASRAALLRQRIPCDSAPVVGGVGCIGLPSAVVAKNDDGVVPEQPIEAIARAAHELFYLCKTTFTDAWAAMLSDVAVRTGGCLRYTFTLSFGRGSCLFLMDVSPLTKQKLLRDRTTHRKMNAVFTFNRPLEYFCRYDRH